MTFSIATSNALGLLQNKHTTHKALHKGPLERELTINNVENECLFTICNFCNVHYKNFSENGSIILESLRAEDMITSLLNDIFMKIREGLGYDSIHIMRSMVEDDPTIFKFESQVILSNAWYQGLHLKFCKYLYDNPESVVYLRQRSLWFHQLLNLEINHVYKEWYGSEPDIALDKDLDEFLKTSQNKVCEDYYNRIHSLATGKLHKLKRR